MKLKLSKKRQGEGASFMLPSIGNLVASDHCIGNEG